MRSARAVNSDWTTCGVCWTVSPVRMLEQSFSAGPSHSLFHVVMLRGHPSTVHSEHRI